MSSFSDMLIYLRKREGLSQQELADKIGLTRSTIGMYETARREPDFETAEALADLFNVNMDTLMGKTTGAVWMSAISPLPSVTMVPRLGAIACGDPILAEQNIEGYDRIPDYIKCDFTLVCRGDSMTGARIFDGDVVCIKQQATVENGQIAAVLIDDEATLKRVRFEEDGSISLWPENPAYAPRNFSGEAMARVRILGVATHFISRVV